MNISLKPVSDFYWVPGEDPDDDALLALCHAFPRPREPMGEAWFMSVERKMYTLALTEPVENLGREQVHAMFAAIITGPPCFGHHDEWHEWFHYLLPRLIPQALREPSQYEFLELLMGGQFSQHPVVLDDRPYRGFRRDVLATLGQAVMSNAFWQDGKLKLHGGLFREKYRYEERWWYLDQASPSISVALFFCVKYLSPAQIFPWFCSVLEIECPLWRSQMIVWLCGARRLITGEITQPAQFKDAEHGVAWEWSHSLSGNYSGDFSPDVDLVDARGRRINRTPQGTRDNPRNVPFIPAENLIAFRHALKTLLPPRVRESLVYEIIQNPLLDQEMGYLAIEFVSLSFSSSHDPSQ